MMEEKEFTEYLDKNTCETVRDDVQTCIDGWATQDLDTRSAIITLTKFAIDLTFEFSYTQTEALQLILGMVHDHMEIPGYESNKEEDPKQIIH